MHSQMAVHTMSRANTQTRSQLQTGQPFPSKNNKRNTDMAVNADAVEKGDILLFVIIDSSRR